MEGTIEPTDAYNHYVYKNRPLTICVGDCTIWFYLDQIFDLLGSPSPLRGGRGPQINVDGIRNLLFHSDLESAKELLDYIDNEIMLKLEVEK
jgi:hypothetical protein